MNTAIEKILLSAFRSAEQIIREEVRVERLDMLMTKSHMKRDLGMSDTQVRRCCEEIPYVQDSHDRHPRYQKRDALKWMESNKKNPRVKTTAS